MLHQGGPGHPKTSKVEALRWYERPMISSFQAYKAAKDRQLNTLLRLANKGLVLKDPDRLDLRGNLSFGRGVCIDTNVIIIGEVRLGDGVAIGANCILEDVEIMAESVIKEFTTVSGSTVGMNCRVGPYARIRPSSFLGKHCQIGNFVEVKNTKMASNCKINHHSFIGDAKIGRNVIIGAGSITCNFDGTKTNLTVIDDNAFVGSGVMLVAPLSVGKNAFIGAGSTVVKEVPANSLTLGRAKQVSIKGWKKKHNEKGT
jgi:bifunctional UDP-N-acetylglucosamine pyrophosphorylase/glucosamine-1-phosphate N-acetyltransferase